MSTSEPKRPAPPAPPLWRQSYDAVEAALGPPLEQFVRSDQFAQGLALVARLRREVEAVAGRTSRQVLHRLNLPAGTDVTRLLNEIGELRKQVRQLTEELAKRDQQSTVTTDATATKRRARGRTTS